MSFGSSAITVRLSNLREQLLNICKRYVRSALPQHCVLCNAASRTAILCKPCHNELPWLPAALCPQCALPAHDGSVCGACLAHPPRLDRVSAALAYAYPLAELIHDFKYSGNLALAPLLGRALAGRIAGRADVLIPMPLAPQRLRERGFNQALEIARVVSHVTGVPLAPHACRRVRDTTPQASLPWNERAQNIRGAFVCDADLAGRRVAIVDDVMTTGATLNELARNLRKTGAAEVYGWVVARTLPR